MAFGFNGDRSKYDLQGLLESLTNLINGKADVGHTHAASDIDSGTFTIAQGGTGAISAEAARSNLGAASTSAATQSANGLMSAADKRKLDATTSDSGWLKLVGDDASATVHQNGIRYRKVGLVVFVDIRGGSSWGPNATTSGYVALGTLPSGYRPSIQLEIPFQGVGTSAYGHFRVSSNGVIEAHCEYGSTNFYTGLFSFPV